MVSTQLSLRALWDLIKSIKTGRIICLTTHYLDEYKIAIMALGSLRVYGLQLFLKRAFDCGYDLTISKHPVWSLRCPHP
jgi:ATP-binding cassette subfamily A (ABC1) protein 3